MDERTLYNKLRIFRKKILEDRQISRLEKMYFQDLIKKELTLSYSGSKEMLKATGLSNFSNMEGALKTLSILKDMLEATHSYNCFKVVNKYFSQIFENETLCYNIMLLIREKDKCLPLPDGITEEEFEKDLKECFSLKELMESEYNYMNLEFSSKVIAGQDAKYVITEKGELFGKGMICDYEVYEMTKLAENVKDTKIGSSHILMLQRDGTVRTMGHNEYGQLGNDGDSKNSEMLPLSVGLENIVQIASCENSCLALDKDGYVYGWGSNAINEIQEGKRHKVCYPVKLPLENIKSIHSGTNGLLAAVNKDNKVFLFGYVPKDNLYTQVSVNNPKTIQFISNVVSIETGWNRLIILLEDGSVYGCGVFDAPMVMSTPLKLYDLTKLFPGKVEKIQITANTYIILQTNGEVFIFHSEQQPASADNKPVKIVLAELIEDISCYWSSYTLTSTNGCVYSWGVGQFYSNGIDTDDDFTNFL